MKGTAFINAATYKLNFFVKLIHWYLKHGIASFQGKHACVIFAYTFPIRINTMPCNHL